MECPRNETASQHGDTQDRVHQGCTCQEMPNASLRGKDMDLVDTVREDGVNRLDLISISPEGPLPVSNHHIDIRGLVTSPFEGLFHGHNDGPRGGA